jgi:spore germination protein KB
LNNRIEKISTIQAILILIISELLSLPYTVLVAIPILYLSKTFNDLTPIQYSEKILGRFFGKFIGILYIAFLLFNCIVHISLLKRFFGAAIIPETPGYAIALFMVATAIYVVYKGIEPLARAGEIFVPIILLVILLFIALGINNMDFNILLPVLSDSSLADINIGALTVSSRYVDIITLCMLVPNLSSKKDITKIFFVEILVTCLFFILITIATQTTLGLKYSAQAEFPFFTYTRTVDVFDFIQRMESVNVMAWIISSILKYSAYLYFATLGVKHIFRLESNKPFIIPFALLTLILTLTLPTKKSIIMELVLSYKTYPYISLPFILGMPLLMLIIYAFRKKSLKKDNN